MHHCHFAAHFRDGECTIQATLIKIPGTNWEQDFGDDVKRKEWHERKMMSKFTRAKRQLDLLGLSYGTAIHCWL